MFACFLIFNCLYVNLGWQTQPVTLPQIQQWNTKKMCGIFSKLTMKTPEEHQCFLMSPCQWSHSGGYSCTWICFKIDLSIIYFIWCMARYKMRWRCVPPKVATSTELWGAQRTLELGFKSTDFCVPKNFSSLAAAQQTSTTKLHVFF